MKHIYGKRAIHIGALLLCSVVLYAGLSTFLKGGSSYPKLRAVWYEQPENSYDLLAVGSSHMNGGYDPAPLEELGVRGVNMATAGEPFEVSYYLLKECLKRQQPKVVLLDVYYMLSLTPYGEDGHTRSVLDQMKLSQNKIEAVQNCAPKSDWNSFYWDFLKYHSRWDQLTPEDFAPWKQFTDAGFFAGAARFGGSLEFTDWSGECAEIPEKQREFLLKFFDLAQEEGFALVLVNFPSDYSATAGDKTWHSQPERMFNSVKKLADGRGIPFLNLCTPEAMTAMNLDFGHDMTNPGHLNHFGAQKATGYINQYLEQNMQELFTTLND